MATKMLVPIDGSEVSLRALQYAMSQAGELHIVNVQPKTASPALLMHLTPQAIEQAHRSHGEAMLADARKLLEQAVRPYHAQVLLGEPAQDIVETARLQGVDSIVMGTRGLGSLANLVLGSVATKVVHLAHVPVTLIK